MYARRNCNFNVLCIIEPSVCDTRSVLIVMFRIIKMVDVNFSQVFPYLNLKLNVYVMK